LWALAIPNAEAFPNGIVRKRFAMSRNGVVYSVHRRMTRTSLLPRQPEASQHAQVWKQVERDLHQKCFCGQPFAIRGSMNFTWNGLNAKEEQMTVSVNPAEVRRLRFELEDRWSQYIEEQA
jgi:hypothetical protein